MQALPKEQIPQAAPQGGEAYDARFRALVGEAGWRRLPEAVRARFSKRLACARVAIYPGVIEEVRFSRAGWLLAQLCRLIGAPLPLHRDQGVPATVSVSEDGSSGGQCWTRIYGRKQGFPQVIHSAKRFAGKSGLEEYLGRGIGMALKVVALEDGLEFRSDHYFLDIGPMRLRLPHWMGPGRTVVRHRDMGEGRFEFSLQLVHPLMGELVYQSGVFRDA